jgi:hypothetical protein
MTEFTTIQEAKAYLRANYSKGVECPCCKQFVKLYKRKLNSGMARTLILIYKESNRQNASGYKERPWIHVKNLLMDLKAQNSHDWTLLKHWGLLEDEITDPDRSANGYWRITMDGVNFVENRLSVPRVASFYNGKLIGMILNSFTDIVAALGDKFNYEELIKS